MHFKLCLYDTTIFISSLLVTLCSLSPSILYVQRLVVGMRNIHSWNDPYSEPLNYDPCEHKIICHDYIKNIITYFQNVFISALMGIFCLQFCVSMFMLIEIQLFHRVLVNICLKYIAKHAVGVFQQYGLPQMSCTTERLIFSKDELKTVLNSFLINSVVPF